jgi:hypothetical protein
MFENFEMVHCYSRADAIRDGVLIDVSATGVVCQDEAGRLWDVLWMLTLATRRCQGPTA